MKTVDQMQAELANYNVGNVEVSLRATDSPMCLSWHRDNARYHIWLEPVTRKIERGIGHKAPTLYKNSLSNPGEPGYVRVRRMDASKHEALIKRIQNFADAKGLFEAATANAAAAEERRLKEARAEADLQRIKEAGPVLLDAVKEAIRYLDAPADSPRYTPASRATLRATLALAMKKAGASM